MAHPRVIVKKGLAMFAASAKRSLLVMSCSALLTLAACSEKKEEPKRKGFGLGLGNLSKGKQAESTQASASAGGRAVDTDRRAPGGDNPNKVSVTIAPAEITAFKSGIA